MDKTKEVAKALNIVPKLRLGNKLAGGGVESTGPHQVKFVEESTIIQGKDDKGNLRKELKFIVEEKGQRYRWSVPVLNKEGQPNYLIERVLTVEVGDERILEMIKARGRNYIDVRLTGEAPNEPDDENEIPVIEGEDGPLTDKDLEDAGLQ